MRAHVYTPSFKSNTHAHTRPYNQTHARTHAHTINHTHTHTHEHTHAHDQPHARGLQTIANMTTEWGALAGVFPADAAVADWYTRRYEASVRRKSAFHTRVTRQNLE